MVDAAILAGGRARRMGGVAKALLEIGGETILARQVKVLRKVAREILLVVGDEEPYRERARELGVRLVRDLHPAQGPLAGLEAALSATSADAVLVVGCDLPFLDETLLELLRDEAPEAQAVVPRIGGRAQPLHARYARQILPVVGERLRRGELRMREMLEGIEVKWLEEGRLREVGGELVGFTNVNTEEEVAAARRWAERGR